MLLPPELEFDFACVVKLFTVVIVLTSLPDDDKKR
jgi:hypothetical protein